MATKDITDLQVVLAYQKSRDSNFEKYPYEYLMEETGQPFKVCYRAMERADRRRLIDSGVSLRTGWLTDKGKELIRKERYEQLETLKTLQNLAVKPATEGMMKALVEALISGHPDVVAYLLRLDERLNNKGGDSSEE